MKKLVIFDLDGTLLDTIDDLATAANYALAQCSLPTHPLSAYPFFVGNGVTKLLERVIPEGEYTDSLMQRMRVAFGEYYDVHCTDLTKPYAGIKELLEQLSAAGVSLAVASNKYQSAVDKLITHFFPTTPWVAVEGHKEGWPVKPDPSIVFGILAKCPTFKDEVLYVGDSGVDMDTARRAAVQSVGVTWGFRPEAELKAHYADIIVNNPADILEIAQR